MESEEKVHIEEETPQEEPQAEATEGHEEEEEAQGTGDIYSLSQWIILMLTESAWQWMGLHKNPVSKKVEKDLAQARIAIDTVVFLVDQINTHVPEEQRRAYRTLISDLRVNFVQQQNQPG